LAEPEQVIVMHHSGLSIGEIEILFNMLRDPFEVAEKVEECPEEGFVSAVSLFIPLPYDNNFFKTFGMDRWDQIKEVLKNLKWRRGKKSVKLVLRFGREPVISFTIHAERDKLFAKALDTIEYLMDVILLQIDTKNLPPNIVEVRYEFDENDYRWYPSMAIGDREFYYVNNEWKAR
jgi:hypothetical protein